jgi:hypothetical protein
MELKKPQYLYSYEELLKLDSIEKSKILIYNTEEIKKVYIIITLNLKITHRTQHLLFLI